VSTARPSLKIVPPPDVTSDLDEGEFIRFDVPEHSDDGIVGAILQAHVRYESARSLRRAWVHLMAALGGVLAFTVILPGLGVPWLIDNVALTWALCGGAALATLVVECRWYVRRKRLLDANKLVGEGRGAP